MRTTTKEIKNIDEFKDIGEYISHLVKTYPGIQYDKPETFIKYINEYAGLMGYDHGEHKIIKKA